jgi:hypothetical protein
MKIRKMGTELVHADGETEGKTDRRTEMTNLIVVFHNFSKAPKHLSYARSTLKTEEKV